MTDRNAGVRLLVRAGFAWAILALALWRSIDAYRVVVAQVSGLYQSADWLINYGGGFVRRGLFGQLWLILTPKGPGSLWWLFWFQVGCYALILAFALTYLHRCRYSWSSIALICGPAALPFVGWDIEGGFRKEILIFVVLIVLAWTNLATRLPSWLRGTLIGLALALWGLAAFSWEATVLVVPAAGFLLLAGEPGRDRLRLWRRISAGLFVAVGVAGLVASTWVPVASGTTGQICRAIGGHGVRSSMFCKGAISALGWSSQEGLELVRTSLPMQVGYLPLLILAVLPIAVSPWLRHNWAWALASLLGVAALFVVGVDYGRWAHILVMSLAICIAASGPEAVESKLWNPISAVLFVSTWGLRHYQPPEAAPEDWPFLGALRVVMEHLSGLLPR
ncbi:hypothetical protein ATK74_1732 [Propionicimonas paludicola]|uniref:DUF2029 domain-containing protein n=1 Tax=Propionicimonas paludicola TaxID=185243 RepID=A0A2A9CU67_9ACTN|nr:hypothetical protein [Propionicimonas paludicola]PFG17170.1 hypothetical protein ATK74_1732 [Propionicimonas paludicola]